MNYLVFTEGKPCFIYTMFSHSKESKKREVSCVSYLLVSYLFYVFQSLSFYIVFIEHVI